MNERSVVVRLRAEVADYRRRMDEAARATRQVGDASKRTQEQATTGMGRLVQSATQNRQAWETAGRGILLFSTLTVAALGASAMAAVQWETDWAGVLKTVDGTTSELEVLEGGLRDMARELPATHSAIAGVAEAAGQLGVRTKDIVGFTRVMVDLGETTNLTADEAATSIAQLMNVMRTAPGDVDRLGAALVALGNNGASTERDIIQMAQRISGAGTVVGLTEAEVLGLANALASVGLEVEAGGTAISRVLTTIAQDVSTGGVALDQWARVAGVSGQQFAQTWEGDPARALALFIEGLGRMQETGQDVFGTLSDLGMSDVRVSRALLNMAASGDLLTRSLDLGTQAWEDNTALAEEAGKRYDTTAAKLQIARNNLNDVAIEAGEVVLPALGSLAEQVAAVAQWFGALPDPVKQGTVALGGIAGAVGLATGGFLLVTPRILDTVLAMKRLQASGSRIPGMLGSIGKAAGVLTVAAAGLTAVTAAIEGAAASSKGVVTSVEETTQALLRMQDAADLDDLFNLGLGVDQVGSLETAIRRVTSPDLLDRMQDIGGTVRGWFGQGTTARTQVEEQFDAVGNALASLVQSGHAEEAARQFDVLAEAWTANGGELEDLRRLMPGYTEALADVANQEELNAGATDGMTEAYNRATNAVEWLTEEQVAWREELAKINASFIDLKGGYDAVVEQQKAWAQETADATESADDSWQDYYDGFSVGLGEWFDEMQSMVDAQNAWETNLLLLSGRVSQGVLDELWRMGAEGAPLVAELVDASDEELARLEGIVAERSQTAMDVFAMTLDSSAEVIAAAAAQLGEDAATEIAEKLAAGTADMQQIVEDYGLVIESEKPEVQIGTTDATNRLDQWIAAQSARTVSVGLRISNSVDIGQYIQSATAPGAGGKSIAGYAGGGGVFGPGTETSDSIPSLLSLNEHVWTAAEVKGAGGHAVVAGLRALARQGALSPVQTMRFADGGSPSWSGALTGLPGPSAGDIAAAMHGMDLTLVIPGTGVREVARIEAAGVLSGAERSAAGTRTTKGRVH